MIWVGEKTATGLDSRTKYDPRISKHFSTEGKEFELTYGAGRAKGYLFTDVISLSEDFTNLQTFQMLAATEFNTHQILGFDGIIGLTRPFKWAEEQTEYCFIKHLYSQKLIKHKVFSFKSIGDDRGKFYIGNYPSDFSNNNYGKCELFNGPSSLQLWSCNLNHFLIGEYNKETFNDKALVVEQEMIIDSGGHTILAPDSALQYFENNYVRHLYEQACTKNETMGISFICPTSIDFMKLPPLSFYFNGSAMKISAKHLFMQHETIANKYLFVVTFYKGLNYWLAGQPIFYENHILFDMENEIIAFTETNNEKELSELNEDIDSSDYTLHIVIGVIAFIILIGIVVTIIVRRKRLSTRTMRIDSNVNLF
jgi:hypothetical protein